MKHLLIEKQLSHYRQNGFIEFEDFLSEKEISLLIKEVTGIYTKKRAFIKHPTPEETYILGKDLYLENKSIRKFCQKKKLTELAKAFCNESLLRIAFDQAFFFEEDFRPDFSLESAPEEIFSFQGLKCLLLFQLDDTETKPDEETPLTLYPLKRGNVIFINPRINLDLSPLFSKKTRLYMIGYSKVNAQYVFNEKDPLTHELKKRGYSFGDTLKEEFHPTC